MRPPIVTGPSPHAVRKLEPELLSSCFFLKWGRGQGGGGRDALEERKGRGVWDPQDGGNKVFPTANFVFSHHGHFRRGGGGGADGWMDGISLQGGGGGTSLGRTSGLRVQGTSGD